jgi:translation initiation factor IF-3
LFDLINHTEGVTHLYAKADGSMMKDNGNRDFYADRADRQAKETQDRPRVNNEIRAYKVRLIDQTGTNVGVVPVQDALFKAREAALDLVEVSPDANPPVCKIMNLGKYLFEQKKKQKDNFHKAPEPRELRLSTGIGQSDLEIKAKKALEFLEEGSKVTLTFKLKGRELKKMDLVEEVVKRLYTIVEAKSTLESKGGTFVLIPKS